MKKKPITCSNALNEAFDYDKPSAFSRGMKVEMGGCDFLFISGTASIDEKGNTVHIGDFTAQTRRMYSNVKKLLESEGATWKDVVKTTIYIKDIKKDYDEFNRIRLAIFEKEGISTYPASVCVQADLCRDDLLVEMEALAITSRPTEFKLKIVDKKVE